MKTLFFGLITLTAAVAGAAPLGLDGYLDQVKQSSSQLRGSKAQDAAYALAAEEAQTAFSPQAKAQVSRYSSQAEAVTTAFSAKDTQVTQWGLGLGKLFGTGTYVGLDYLGDKSLLDFGSPGLGTFENWGQQYTLTLSQPLWRNVLAKEAKAGIAQASAGADAARAGNRYQSQSLLFQARATYIQLSTVRQALALQAESLERNQKLLDWTKRKYADNLADKVDVLQVEAALRQVQLALSQSREEEAKARTRFNQMRGQASGAEVEELEALMVPTALPAPKATRQDLEAMLAQARGGDALVEATRQRYTPDISVFATLGTNDRDKELGPTNAGVFKGEHASTLVGLKASANLDWTLIQKALEGARKAQGAGEALVQAKRQELASDWAQLTEQWTALQARLQLASELEMLQKEKAEREKRRYQDGRTTNFQVLRFEEDYNLSRIQTLQLKAGAAMLEAQARLYNGDDQPW